jgi:hypothetical protein
MQFLPWTSYVVLPLFALANAGVDVSADVLGRAFTSPVTLGILAGYLAGKPIGIGVGTWLVWKLSRQRLRPPVGWIGVLGTGAAAGTGFTISLLVAALAFLFGVLTDAPLGAVGGATMVFVLSNILDSITALGDLRVWLPTHDATAWAALLEPQVTWDGLLRGACTAVAYAVVLAVLAWRTFERKDVTS